MEWFKRSERTPEEYGTYIITWKDKDGWFWVDTDFYDDDGWCDHSNDQVVAWMPLPEPWDGAEDGE